MQLASSSANIAAMWCVWDFGQVINTSDHLFLTHPWPHAGTAMLLPVQEVAPTESSVAYLRVPWLGKISLWSSCVL